MTGKGNVARRKVNNEFGDGDAITIGESHCGCEIDGV